LLNSKTTKRFPRKFCQMISLRYWR
jgi:hypothetical protein